MRPYWATLLALMDDWEGEILRFFDVPAAVQNAFMKSQEALQLAGEKLRGDSPRGYSFDAIRIKLMLESLRGTVAEGTSLERPGRGR